MKRLEQDLQIGVVAWLRAALIAPARVWHVPNNMGGSAVQGGIYKAMGLTKGVHDLHFIWPRGDNVVRSGFGTIEMKPPGGVGGLSAEQVAFGGDMAACGHNWEVAESLDEVLDILTRWGVPLRSRTETVKFAFGNGIALKLTPDRWGRR
jgi:hypothetical protein